MLLIVKREISDAMRQKRREGNRCVIAGNIGDIRAIEDSIRATKKYTEGIRTMRMKHPVQGEEFSSKVFTKYYEVYPAIELSWDMAAGVALDWLWGDTPCLDIWFWYDYRGNKASMEVRDGPAAVEELIRAIPGFGEAVAVAKHSCADVKAKVK